MAVKKSAYAQTVERIDTWHKHVIGAQHEGHEIALICLKHAADHGDVTLLERLVLGLRDRGDGKAHAYVTGLTDWIRQFSPVIVKKDGTWALAKPGSSKFKAFDIEGATKTPFWRLTPEGVDKMLNADEIKKGLFALKKKLQKAIDGEKGEFDPSSPITAERVMSALDAAIRGFDSSLLSKPDNDTTVTVVVQEGEAQAAPALKVA